MTEIETVLLTKDDLCEIIDSKLQPVIALLGVSEKRILAAEAALDIYSSDPHQFSSRPCATCKNISQLLGRRWGCNLLRSL